MARGVRPGWGVLFYQSSFFGVLSNWQLLPLDLLVVRAERKWGICLDYSSGALLVGGETNSGYRLIESLQTCHSVTTEVDIAGLAKDLAGNIFFYNGPKNSWFSYGDITENSQFFANMYLRHILEFDMNNNCTPLQKTPLFNNIIHFQLFLMQKLFLKLWLSCLAFLCKKKDSINVLDDLTEMDHFVTTIDWWSEALVLHAPYLAFSLACVPTKLPKNKALQLWLDIIPFSKFLAWLYC